jgi:hypothetical protein
MFTPSIRPICLTVALLGAALSIGPIAAQTTDAGTLLVRIHDREAGTESFSITTTAHMVFAGHRPVPEFIASLDRVSSEEFAFQLETRGPAGGGQTYAVQKRNRLTVRRVARGAEQATELPGGAAVIILADSVFTPYMQAAILATDAGRALTAVLLPDARRVAFTASRSTSANGSTIRLTGGVVAEIQLGNRGELLRISLPGSGIEAVRRRE